MTYPSTHASHLVEQTSELVAAYLSYNCVPTSDVPQLIESVHRTLMGLRMEPGAAPGEPLPTEAQIKASVRHDGIVSFIDGKPYQTLKRHLTAHGLTPGYYRTRYGLPADYPMVAPAYAARRSSIAKQIQLGHKAA